MSTNRRSAFAPSHLRFEEAAVTGVPSETCETPSVEPRAALVRGNRNLHALTVGVDFSPHSMRAARRAAMLARESAARRVSFVHALPGTSATPEDEVQSIRLRAATIARELALSPGTHAHVEVRRGSAAAALAGAAESSDLVVIGATANPLAQHVIARMAIARAAAVPVARGEQSAFGAVPAGGGRRRFVDAQSERVAVGDRMQRLRSSSASDNVTPRIVNGRTASRVAGRAHELDADLVVVAPASKSALERWLLPSVTASIMTGSTRDVLVLPESA